MYTDARTVISDLSGTQRSESVFGEENQNPTGKRTISEEGRDGVRYERSAGVRDERQLLLR